MLIPKIILSTLLLGLSFSLTAQCSGNLGENIFTDGDFGSGSDNILQTNPNIAPGYDYTTSPPPNDGSYVITNNTTTWGSFAELWSDIGDNSADPNGYMMVVNASFTPGLFYEQEVTGLCENTLYVFSADIYNVIVGPEWIKPNVSFLLDGDIAFSTGDIPDNDMWITYGFTFTTAPGQTSVTLALANNAPGGNGNDLALDNITFRPCGPEALILPDITANICEDGEPFTLNATINGEQYDTPVIQWQQSFDEGQNWQDLPGENGTSFVFSGLASGEYYYRYLLANAPGNLLNSRCRVVSNTKIVNVIPKFYTIVDTLCEGLGFDLNDVLYTQSGVYVDSLLTSLGCDSIVTLELTIVPDANIQGTFTVTDPSCADFADGTIMLDTVTGGYIPVSLVINDTITASTTLTDLPDGDYRYLFSDRFGCTQDTTFSLQDPVPFELDLGADQLVELGQEVRLSAVSSDLIDTLFWSGLDSFRCLNADCSIISYLPTESSFVLLNARSQGIGCPAVDSVFVGIIDARKVYIPNAFSPNGDGVNDNFTIFGAQPNVQSIEQFRVFDRWGGLVYEEDQLTPNDAAAGWDGTHQGKKAAAGVYVYQASIRFLDGQVIEYAGHVSLLK